MRLNPKYEERTQKIQRIKRFLFNQILSEYFRGIDGKIKRNQ